MAQLEERKGLRAVCEFHNPNWEWDWIINSILTEMESDFQTRGLNMHEWDQFYKKLMLRIKINFMLPEYFILNYTKIKVQVQKFRK